MQAIIKPFGDDQRSALLLVLARLSDMIWWDCPMECHLYHLSYSFNCMCLSYPTSHFPTVVRVGLSHGIHHPTHSTLCILPIPMSYLGQVRLSHGIHHPTHSILCILPIPMSYLGQVALSHGIHHPTHSILCVLPTPMSYLGQVGLSHGIHHPTHSILCILPIPMSYLGQEGLSHGIPFVVSYSLNLTVPDRTVRWDGRIGLSEEDSRNGIL